MVKQQWYNIDDPLVFEALSMISDGGLNTASVKVLSAFKARFIYQYDHYHTAIYYCQQPRDSMQANSNFRLA